MDVLREAHPDSPTPYKIVVTRFDHGHATMRFMFNGEPQAEVPDATRAGWDDATPWQAGLYAADRAYSWRDDDSVYDPVGRFRTPMWWLNDNAAQGMAGRTAIELHVGQTNTTNPVSYGSFGCLVADARFLHDVDRFIAAHGPHGLQIEVVDDASVSAKVGIRISLPPALTVGKVATGRIELTGDPTGLSKDLWVRLPMSAETSGKLKLTAVEAPSWFAAKRNSSDGKFFKQGWYVKLPAGKTEVPVLVEARSVYPAIRSDEIRIDLRDYAIFSPSGSGRPRYYSDAVEPRNLLIKNAAGPVRETVLVECRDAACLLDPSRSAAVPASIAATVLLCFAIFVVWQAKTKRTCT